jgi:hypothetical protein
MLLHWPQITMAVLMLLEIGFFIAKHGEPRKGNYSVWEKLFSVALLGALLYFGGFWG